MNLVFFLFTLEITVVRVGWKPCGIALVPGFCPFELISFNFWSITRVFVATFAAPKLSLSLLNIPK